MRAVTLISDFGTKDHYTALLKGAILGQQDLLHFIDVSHEVDTHDIRQAAYFLKAIYRKFPPGTIHIVAVNNYYQPDFEILCFKHKEQFYIGPNNGIFSLAFDALEEITIHRILLDDLEHSLFDLIAHGVSVICQGHPITQVGPPLNYLDRKLDVQPVSTDNEIRATITHIDKYDNVILNVHREFFEHFRQNRRIEIYFKYNNPVTRISKTYSEVSIGEVVCLFNSANYLEIAINMGRAATQLDLQKDETVQIKFL